MEQDSVEQTVYAAYQDLHLTQASLNGAVLWDETSGVCSATIPSLTTWATAALGNDPWHAQRYTPFVEAELSALSIVGPQKFSSTLPAIIGTRCIFNTNSLSTYNGKPVTWLDGGVYGGTLQDRPHRKELVALVDMGSWYDSFGLKTGTGGTTNCSATLFKCDTPNQGNWGTGGGNVGNALRRLFS